LFFGVLLSLVAQVPPTSQPAATTRSAEDDKKLEVLRLEAEAAGLPIRKFDSIDAVIRFSRKGDQLIVACTINDIDELTRLLVRGTPGMLKVRLLGEAPPAELNEPRSFQFTQNDLTGPGSMNVVTDVSWAAGRLSVARGIEDERRLSNVQLLQAPPSTQLDPSEPAVKLYITRHNSEDGKPELDLKLQATTFTQLCLDHPREVDEYLRPIIRDFKQEAAVFAPDPKAAWQAFAEDAAPDAATIERVNAVAKKLDAEDFRDREAALNALQEIGQPAALVLMKADRKSMSPEKQSSVDTFLAPYLPLAADEARRVHDDPIFLLDCLSLDDVTLREVAWKRLVAVAHPKVQYDPRADDATRARAATELRESLHSRPTTTPSQR